MGQTISQTNPSPILTLFKSPLIPTKPTKTWMNIILYTHTHTHKHIRVFLIRSQSFQSHRFSLGIRVFDFSNRTHTNLLFSSVSSIATIFIFVMVSFFFYLVDNIHGNFSNLFNFAQLRFAFVRNSILLFVKIWFFGYLIWFGWWNFNAG